MTVRFDLAASPAVPRDAATVLLLREARGDGTAPEIFFVKRNAGARFMGGAYVFPGGRLDPGDADPAVPCDLDAAEAARRLGDADPARARALHVAALRECLEESGVLLGATADGREVPLATVALLRAALAPREAPPIAAVLAPHGVVLRARALVPIARWITPAAETRRFDARFFAARVPEGSTAGASHDGSETVASGWHSARAAIERAHRGEIVLAPPTYRTLETLLGATTVDEALALAVPPPPLPGLEPAVVSRDGALVVLLPDDPAHPGYEPRASSSPAGYVTRFRYDDGTWVPER